MLDQLVLALQDLRNQTYKPPAALPRYWESSPLPEDMMQSTAYDLETVSMPPELYDVDEDRWQTGEGQISALRFFADDVSSTSVNHDSS
jgi:nuclear cap-binding protein subunit 1